MEFTLRELIRIRHALSVANFQWAKDAMSYENDGTIQSDSRTTMRDQCRAWQDEANNLMQKIDGGQSTTHGKKDGNVMDAVATEGDGT